MTNNELIAKIKAEIERLKDENNNIRCDSNKPYCQGYGDAFADLLPFLNILESEKLVPNYLEEVAEEYLQKVKAEFLRTLEHPTAKDCFIDGAKWQKEQDDRLVDTIYQQGIEKGKDDMKEQMMKEAVEGEIFDEYDKDICEHHLTILFTVPSGYKNGDKVKIIVIHETDIR